MKNPPSFQDRLPLMTACIVFMVAALPLLWLFSGLRKEAEERDRLRLGGLVTGLRKALLAGSAGQQQLFKNWALRLEGLAKVDDKNWHALFLGTGTRRTGRFRAVGYASQNDAGAWVVEKLEGDDNGGGRWKVGADLRSLPELRGILESVTPGDPPRQTGTRLENWPAEGDGRFVMIAPSGGRGILFALNVASDLLLPEQLKYGHVDGAGQTQTNLVQEEFLPGIGEGLITVEHVPEADWDAVHARPDRPFMFKLLGPMGNLNLIFHPGPKFAGQPMANDSWLMGGGLTLAFLLALISWMQARGKGNLVRLVEQRTAELREANTELGRFQSIAETTSDLVAMCLLDGTPLYLNPAGRTLLGIPAGEPVDHHQFRDIYTPETLDLIMREGIPHAMEKGPWSTELNLQHRDGSEIPVSFVGFVIKSPEGRPLHLGSMARDISARRRLDAQLRGALEQQMELVRAKSGFVSTVSHEFRTPLGVILSSADILTHYSDRLPPEIRTEHLRDIHESSLQMSRMLDQVLDLGRIESGKYPCAVRPLELGPLLQRIVDESHSASVGCPIRLTMGADLAGVEAEADEALLRHILFNLLSNARKYSPADAVVEFSVVRENRDAVFTVTDRGIGIPTADLPRLFEAFCRGGNVGTAPGTGLGLSIVKHCVDLHGGSIQVESHEGQGTTARVRLPLFKPSIEP